MNFYCSMGYIFFMSLPSNLDITIQRVQNAVEGREGQTLGQKLVGGLENLLTLMDAAGYELFSYPGLDFDTSFDIGGNEVLLIHCTKQSSHGQWGLVWRSVWALDELKPTDLAALIQSIDAGVRQLAQAAEIQAAAKDSLAAA